LQGHFLLVLFFCGSLAFRFIVLASNISLPLFLSLSPQTSFSKLQASNCQSRRSRRKTTKYIYAPFPWEEEERRLLLSKSVSRLFSRRYAHCALVSVCVCVWVCVCLCVCAR